jgi:hypothetical protein
MPLFGVAGLVRSELPLPVSEVLAGPVPDGGPDFGGEVDWPILLSSATELPP